MRCCAGCPSSGAPHLGRRARTAGGEPVRAGAAAAQSVLCLILPVSPISKRRSVALMPPKGSTVARPSSNEALEGKHIVAPRSQWPDLKLPKGQTGWPGELLSEQKKPFRCSAAAAARSSGSIDQLDVPVVLVGSKAERRCRSPLPPPLPPSPPPLLRCPLPLPLPPDPCRPPYACCRQGVEEEGRRPRESGPPAAASGGGGAPEAGRLSLYSWKRPGCKD